MNQIQKNTRLAGAVVAFVIGMVCLSYASVPLYSLFCKVTGWGGTTQRVIEPSHVIGSREITVNFNANTDGALAWNFKPEQRSMRLKTGENKLAFFSAENLANEEITGTATFNVTPEKAGIYFNKVQCFCFTNQPLKAKEKMTLPVSFFIDPAMEKDPEMKDVDIITLSYSFFKVKK
jgi:cytochrome c oxidase assembly protein subunit 11